MCLYEHIYLSRRLGAQPVRLSGPLQALSRCILSGHPFSFCFSRLPAPPLSPLGPGPRKAGGPYTPRAGQGLLMPPLLGFSPLNPEGDICKQKCFSQQCAGYPAPHSPCRPGPQLCQLVSKSLLPGEPERLGDTSAPAHGHHPICAATTPTTTGQQTDSTPASHQHRFHFDW